MKRFNAVMNGQRPFETEETKVEILTESQIKEREQKKDMERMNKSLNGSIDKL